MEKKRSLSNMENSSNYSNFVNSGTTISVSVVTRAQSCSQAEVSALNTLSVLPLAAAGAFPLFLHPGACQSLPWISLTVPRKRKKKKSSPSKTSGQLSTGVH